MADIFVFGSNLKGIHKKGAALHALNNHGAILGQGVGQMGTCYAIPTKGSPYNSLSIASIWPYIWEFMNWVRAHKDNVYKLTPIGCGLAGHDVEDIAGLFSRFNPPRNLRYPKEFLKFLPFMADRPDLIANFPSFTPKL